MPTTQDARKFADALKTIESTRNPHALIALFATEATIDSVALHKPIHGIGAIAEFWQDYIAFFAKIETTFTEITATDSIAVLEWLSKGQISDGVTLEYRGVSLLKFDGGKVTSFRTYYDSAAFVPEFEKHLKRQR